MCFYVSVQRSISNKNNENRASKVIDRFERAGIPKTYKHTMTVHTMHWDHHSNETLVASGATTTITWQAYYTMCRRSGSRRTIKSPICEPPTTAGSLWWARCGAAAKHEPTTPHTIISQSAAPSHQSNWKCVCFSGRLVWGWIGGGYGLPLATFVCAESEIYWKRQRGYVCIHGCGVGGCSITPSIWRLSAGGM